MSRDSERIREAKKIRERKHRLGPGLRLKTVNEISKFIDDNGLVSVLGGNELPGLISAILGRPWRPSAKGFTGWLDWWSIKVEGHSLPRLLGELERGEDVLSARIFRHSKTLVSSKLWPALDTIIQYQNTLLTRGEILSPLELKLRTIIESEGAIRTDRLRKHANLEGKENNYKFHRSLTNLESYGLIVGAEDAQPERHMHANIWQTWEKRTGPQKKNQMQYEEACLKLLELTINASVLVHQDDVSEFFAWSASMDQAKEALIKAQTIVLANDFLIPAHIFKPT